MARPLGRELSLECFEDKCDWCDFAGCECRCHRWQEWHPLRGWMDIEEAEEGV